MAVSKSFCYKLLMLNSILFTFSKRIYLAQGWIWHWRRKFIFWPQLATNMAWANIVGRAWSKNNTIRKDLSSFWSAKWVNASLVLIGNFNRIRTLTLIEAAHRWGEAKSPSLPKVCHAYPKMTKLDTVLIHNF